MHKFQILLALAFGAILQLAIAESGIRFYVYTRRNQNAPQELTADVESIVRSSYFALDPTIITIPRWQGAKNAPENAVVTELQLAQQTCNVVVVDLSVMEGEGAAGDNISTSAKEISDFVILLNEHFDVATKHIHLVGFSEGAHIAGEVGQFVQAQIGSKIHQITALDPSEYAETHLSADAAQFVEVIHTNAGGKGTATPAGHVDFYPNGGSKQPNCSSVETDSENHCSHERAYELLNEMWSSSNNFLSAKCATTEKMSADSCRWSHVKMGQTTDRNGIYYLDTNGKPPYAKGAYYTAFL